MLSPTPSADPLFTEMSVAMYSATASAAGRLEISGMFELDANAASKVLFLEATVKPDDQQEAYEMVDGQKVVQYVVRRAFGLRIAIQVASWDVNSSLSISKVVAKSQVKGQSIQYCVETLGLPQDLEHEILQAVGVAGLLDESSFRKLRALVTETLPAYLRLKPAANPDRAKGERAPLRFVDFRVPVESSSTTFDFARSVHFAMTHLARGDSLAQAKDALRGSPLARDVGKDIVEHMYAKYGGTLPSKEKDAPPADAVSAARKWLQFQS